MFDFKKFLIGDIEVNKEENTEENIEDNKENDTQGGGNEPIKQILILILIVLTIGISVYVFTVFHNYYKVEKQYQKCVESCRSLFEKSDSTMLVKPTGRPKPDSCQEMCALEVGR